MSETLLRRAMLLGLLLLGVLLSTLTRQNAPTLPGEFAARTAPLFGYSYRFGQNFRGAVAALFDRRNLRETQRQMLAELQSLKAENQRLTLENRRLQSTLRVQNAQGVGVAYVAAVLDDDPSGFYHRLYLGAGSKQGLRVGMPVTTAGGLVGVITDVTPSGSVVRTLLDPESRVGVRLSNSPGRGIAYGAPPWMLRVELSPAAKVKVGDRIVSGALQGLYPAGLTVGTVTEVQPMAPGALKQIVMVRPAVEFSLLEEVQVLKPL
ncbi:MAG: rod shape-determining protein MreC [Meiothermus sp.]